MKVECYEVEGYKVEIYDINGWLIGAPIFDTEEQVLEYLKEYKDFNFKVQQIRRMIIGE